MELPTMRKSWEKSNLTVEYGIGKASSQGGDCSICLSAPLMSSPLYCLLPSKCLSWNPRLCWLKPLHWLKLPTFEAPKSTPSVCRSLGTLARSDRAKLSGRSHKFGPSLQELCETYPLWNQETVFKRNGDSTATEKNDRTLIIMIRGLWMPGSPAPPVASMSHSGSSPLPFKVRSGIVPVDEILHHLDGWKSINHTEIWGGLHSHGATLIAGWFISWNIPSRNGN